MKNRALICQLAAWTLSLLVCLLAFVAWGGDYGWHLGHLSTYQLFPLLGLLAFSLMWAHYVSAAVRQLLDLDFKVLQRYFRLTSFAVLVLICLHPGLLIYQRFRDGYGLPPRSYESYVAPSMAWITLLGTASLLAFLAYELHRFYKDRTWWHWIATLSDVAMLAVFYHGLRLGSQLSHQGWFRMIWWFYGLSLALILVRNYYLKYLQRSFSKKPAV
jgi:hypothetical protein